MYEKNISFWVTFHGIGVDCISPEKILEGVLMKTFKRWIKNLKWLFNHPPTLVTEKHFTELCEFCGGEGDWKNSQNGKITIVFCFPCLSKAMHKILDKKVKK